MAIGPGPDVDGAFEEGCVLAVVPGMSLEVACAAAGAELESGCAAAGVVRAAPDVGCTTGAALRFVASSAIERTTALSAPVLRSKGPRPPACWVSNSLSWGPVCQHRRKLAPHLLEPWRTLRATQPGLILLQHGSELGLARSECFESRGIVTGGTEQRRSATDVVEIAAQRQQ